MQWELGCFDRPWYEHDLETALDGIAQAGFKILGLLRVVKDLGPVGEMSPQQVDDLRKRIEDHGLRVVVIRGASPVGQEGIDALKKDIDHAKILGAESVLLGGTSKPEQYDEFYRGAAPCASHAALQGMTIVMKPHGGISATAQDCLTAIERVGSDHFRIWHDPGNIVYYVGDDPVQDVKQVVQYVSGICLKDTKGGKKGEVMITPGTGEVDFEAYFRALAEGGFSGPMIIECLSSGSPQQLVQEAIKAREFISGKLPARNQS